MKCSFIFYERPNHNLKRMIQKEFWYKLHGMWPKQQAKLLCRKYGIATCFICNKFISWNWKLGLIMKATPRKYQPNYLFNKGYVLECLLNFSTFGFPIFIWFLASYYRYLTTYIFQHNKLLKYIQSFSSLLLLL